MNWYEDMLPAGERKRRGHFSTPPQLVELMLDACGYTPAYDLTHIRVLDPACGSGNFLAAAAQRLLRFSQLSNSPTQRKQCSLRLLGQNLWGFDPDPVACFMAKMHLQYLVAGSEGSAKLRPKFHIHQADALTFPWETSEAFDLLLANPPYLAAKNSDLSGYRRSLHRGQADSYLLFLELALRVVRPGGWIGLVLPDPLLARINAASERRQLLEQVTIHHLWHLSDVFTAQVGAAVIIGQKHAPSSTHQIVWVRDTATRFLKENSAPTQTINQSLLLQQPFAEFRYLLSSEAGQVIERLQRRLTQDTMVQRHFAPLRDFVSITRGEELGRKSNSLTQNFSEGDLSWLPVLRGGVDIRAYRTPASDWWIERKTIEKPLERYQTPKLVVVKSTDRLQATLDLKGHVTLQTLYLLHLRTQERGLNDLYFYLALLNSRLLQQYVYVLYTAYKWVQPQIEQHVLAHLPIPLVEDRQKQPIIERAKLLIAAYDQITDTSEPLPEAVRALYEEQEQSIVDLYRVA